MPIPGASALIAALSVEGLPTDRFAFEGFLPAKPATRRKALVPLVEEARTLIFYESSHRIEETLQDLAQVFGEQRQAVVLRELTKFYESIYRGTLADLVAQIAVDTDMSRGEFVVVVAGKVADADSDQLNVLAADKVLRILLEELPVKQAAAIAAKLTGLPKNQLYKQALAMDTLSP